MNPASLPVKPGKQNNLSKFLKICLLPPLIVLFFSHGDTPEEGGWADEKFSDGRKKARTLPGCLSQAAFCSL